MNDEMEFLLLLVAFPVAGYLIFNFFFLVLVPLIEHMVGYVWRFIHWASKWI